MHTDNQNTEERRNGEPAIPPHLHSYLNPEQMSAIHQVEKFGWFLAFVRRPLFQPSIPILQNRDNPSQYAILQDDGEIDFNAEILVRA